MEDVCSWIEGMGLKARVDSFKTNSGEWCAVVGCWGGPVIV